MTERKDIIMLMGDMNAKIGKDNKGYESIMGLHGLVTINENGERFRNLYAAHDLVIGGSIFPHKEIHKTTWMSPDHKTRNQIDHVAIDKKFRRCLQDVRVIKGADSYSDHHLVRAKLTLKLRKYSQTNIWKN